MSWIQKERMANLENAIQTISEQGGAHIFVSDNLAPNFIEAVPRTKLKNQTRWIDWIVFDRGKCADCLRNKYLDYENISVLMKSPHFKILKHTPNFSLFQDLFLQNFCSMGVKKDLLLT